MKKYTKPQVVVNDIELKYNMLTGSNTDYIPIVSGKSGDVAQSKEDFDDDYGFKKVIESDIDDEMEDLW